LNNGTIQDIAKKAGVAKSTVSRVLNGGINVSEKTREKVMRIIEETKYQPSELARGLSTKASNVIGVITPDSASYFWGQVLEGISEVVESNNFTAMLCITNNSWSREHLALQKMRGQRVNGLLITPSVEYNTSEHRKEFLQDLESLNCPIVFIDRAVRNSRWDGVYFDNYNGAYLATDALIQKGCHKIGAIIGDIALNLGKERKDGFLQALSDAGLETEEKYIYFNNYKISLMDSYGVTKNWIKKAELPEAVLLSNGMIANGFIKALLEEGLTPGRDVICLGFDYVEALDVLNLDYSYLDRDAVNMGRIAAKMLFEQTNGERREYIIPVTLKLSKNFYNNNGKTL
jgi:LacI family transcriptional regulator